jgi:hemerythrin-like domain-containing protein
MTIRAGRNDAVDAIVLLKEQHRAVEKMFKAFARGDLSVVPDICDALERHAELEETTFYPFVRAEVPDETAAVLEAFEEHLIVKRLVAELRELTSKDEAYAAKATVLMENVRHHVREEEDEMFPVVRSALGRKRLTELGDRLAAGG